MKNKNGSKYWVLYVGDQDRYEAAYSERKPLRAFLEIRASADMGSEARDMAAGIAWEPLGELPPARSVWDPDALDFRPDVWPGSEVREALKNVEEAELKRRASAGEQDPPRPWWQRLRSRG